MVGFKTVVALGYYGVHNSPDVLDAMQARLDISRCTTVLLEAIRQCQKLIPANATSAYSNLFPQSRRICEIIRRPYDGMKETISAPGITGVPRIYPPGGSWRPQPKIISCHLGGSSRSAR